MRHGKKFNHLSRKAAHRKSMLANMACSLIEHKRIKTTLAKAKALRRYIEPLITKSKNDTTHSRRIVFSYLKQKDAITILFGEISSKIAERSGGYIRILKLGNRLGDNAQMAYVEFVDYNEEYITDKPKRKKARRTRKKKSTSSSIVEMSPVEEASSEEIPVEEASSEASSVKEASSVEEATSEVSSVEEATSEVSPVEKASSEEMPVEEASSEASSVEEATSEVSSVKEASSVEEATSEVSSDSSPVEEDIDEKLEDNKSNSPKEDKE